MALPFGKIPVDILKDIVFKNLGAKRDEVVLGPAAGIDGAVVRVGSKSMIVSMDPITGAIKRIGWLAVNINANDVSTFGVEPTFFLSCIMLPEKAKKDMVETICTQMDKAARNLGIALVGGHCEVTPNLPNPIVVGCAIGMTEKDNYVTAADAKATDKLILTKIAGIEGTAILATDKARELEKAVDPTTLRNAREFFDQISVVKEATIAFKAGGVDAMHDPTEGGIAGGIHEMADASNLGFKIYEKSIPIAKETMEICRFFKIDPLYLVASGSMLIAAKPNAASDIVEDLKRNRVNARIIGEFLASPEKRTIECRNDVEKELARPVCDHLWLALKKHS